MSTSKASRSQGTSQADRKGKTKDSPDGTKELRTRVEEHRMWKDENSFKDMEYERRRNDKRQRKGVLKSDKVLQRWKKCYGPAILAIVAGSALMLCSSLDSLAGDTALFHHRQKFQTVGGVLAGVGIIGLMVAAAYTYYREDKVRMKYGFPNLFEASRCGTPSGAALDETFALRNEFVDEPANLESSCNGRLSRMTSFESSNTSIGNLGASFSSTSSARTWVHRHAPRFQRSISMIRRQNSDTALDKSYARARWMAWQRDLGSEGLRQETTTRKDAQTPNNMHNAHPSVSQTTSVSSTASSGYHSNISSPGISQPFSIFQKRKHRVDDRSRPVILTDEQAIAMLHSGQVNTFDNNILKIVVEDTQSKECLEEEIVLGGPFARIHNSKAKTHPAELLTRSISSPPQPSTPQFLRHNNCPENDSQPLLTDVYTPTKESVKVP